MCCGVAWQRQQVVALEIHFSKMDSVITGDERGSWCGSMDPSSFLCFLQVKYFLPECN